MDYGGGAVSRKRKNRKLFYIGEDEESFGWFSVRWDGRRGEGEVYVERSLKGRG